MNITPKDIKFRKRVGTLHGKAVEHLLTTGGLHCYVVPENGRDRVLMFGPHVAVARYGAMKREPDMVITELSKSDYVDEVSILSVLPKYEALTDAVNEALNLR